MDRTDLRCPRDEESVAGYDPNPCGYYLNSLLTTSPPGDERVALLWREFVHRRSICSVTSLGSVELIPAASTHT